MSEDSYWVRPCTDNGVEPFRLYDSEGNYVCYERPDMFYMWYDTLPEDQRRRVVIRDDVITP